MSAAEALKNEGNVLLKSDDIKGAIGKYTEAITLDPTNQVYYSNRSAAFIKNNELMKALDDAVKAIELKPTWAKGYSRKGASLYALNRMEEAKIAYEEASKLEPNNPTFRAEIDRCKSHLSGPGGSQPMGNPMGQNPAEIFQKLSTDPRTSGFMSDPGYLTMLQELSTNPANAMKHMNDPRMQATLQVMFGVNLGADKDGNPEVIPDPTAEKAAPPPSSAPKFSMDDMDTSGPTETKKQKQEEKMETQEQESPKEEDNNKEQAKKVKEEGNAHYKKKELDLAIAKYDEAIRLDPGEVTYYNNKSAAVLEKIQKSGSSDFSEARDLCKKAIEIGRENRADYKNIAKALKRIGTCYEKEGDRNNAIEWYNKSLAEHRDKATVSLVQKLEKEQKELDRLDYFDAELAETARAEGNDFFKKGKFPEAIKKYDEGMKRTPDGDKETLAKFFSNRAGCFMKLMEFHRAQKDCEESLKLKPDFVKCWIRKGAVLEAQKQHDNALEAYRKALELDPNAKEASEGMNRQMTAKYASRNDPDQVRQRAMNDPEVQQIMGDPSMRMILEQMQSNPAAAMEHMKNPDIANKIQKLVDVGLISVSHR